MYSGAGQDLGVPGSSFALGEVTATGTGDGAGSAPRRRRAAVGDLRLRVHGGEVRLELGSSRRFTASASWACRSPPAARRCRRAGAASWSAAYRCLPGVLRTSRLRGRAEPRGAAVFRKGETARRGGAGYARRGSAPRRMLWRRRSSEKLVPSGQAWRAGWAGAVRRGRRHASISATFCELIHWVPCNFPLPKTESSCAAEPNSLSRPPPNPRSASAHRRCRIATGTTMRSARSRADVIHAQSRAGSPRRRRAARRRSGSVTIRRAGR